MFKLNYRSISWWYWLVTVCFLTAGVSGWSAGFQIAIGITVLQLTHFIIRERSLVSFPIQVRLGYLFLLLISLQENLQLIYWIPTIGTWGLIFFGYCTMARLLSLLPWNRKEVFSFALLMRTIFSAPVEGNILHGFPPVRPHA